MLSHDNTYCLRVALVWLLFTLNNSAAAVHFSPNDDWQTLQSDKIYLNYHRQDQALAESALMIAEQALQQLSLHFNWQPKNRIQITLSDQQDGANGFARPLPYNHVVLFTGAPHTFSELSDYEQWLRTLLLHELTHIVHIDKARNWTETPRHFVGRNLFLFANVFQPNFFKEGLATYMETSWQRGTGRGQSAYYQMILRNEVEHGLLPLAKVQQNSRDWPLNKAYSYGLGFYQFLDDVYGPETITDFIETYSGQLWPFLIDRPVRHHTEHNDLEALWSAYLLWLETRYRPQLAEIKKAGMPATQQLSQHGYVTGAPLLDAQGAVYYVQFDPYHPSYLSRIDLAGEQTQLTRISSQAELIGSDETRVWFLQPASCEHHSSSFDLYEYDVPENSTTRLSHCQHYIQGSIQTLSGKPEMIAVKSLGHYQQLVHYDLESEQQTLLYQGQSEEHFASPSWLPDAKGFVVAHKQKNRNWNIALFELASQGISTLKADSETNYFTVSAAPDGQLYMSTDANQLIEIWRMNPDGTGLEQVTRNIGGATHPAIDLQGQQIVYRQYGANGWNVARQPLAPVASASISTLEKPGAGYEIDWNHAAEIDFQQHDYQAWRSVWPTTWGLAFSSDNAHTETSILLSGQDALGFHQWGLNLGRDSKNDHNLTQFSYTLYQHLSLFYDRHYEYALGGDNAPNAFIDEKIEEEKATNYSVIAHGKWPMKDLAITWFSGANQEQEQHFSFLTEQDFFAKRVKTLGAGIALDTTIKPLKSISPAFGRRIQINLERDFISATNFSQLSPREVDSQGNVWSVDWQEFIHLYQAHTLVLSLFEGRAERGADHFDLHGDINNGPFRQPFIHQRDLRLRGYPDQTPELIGRRAELYSAEYRFPLAHIDQGWSGWPLGLRDVSGTVFFESGKASEVFEHHDSLGLELKAGLDLGYSLLPVEITLGLALPLKATLANPDKDSDIYTQIRLGF